MNSHFQCEYANTNLLFMREKRRGETLYDIPREIEFVLHVYSVLNKPSVCLKLSEKKDTFFSIV
jgi:hypothetical protein